MREREREREREEREGGFVNLCAHVAQRAPDPPRKPEGRRRGARADARLWGERRDEMGCSPARPPACPPSAVHGGMVTASLSPQPLLEQRD